MNKRTELFFANHGDFNNHHDFKSTILMEEKKLSIEKNFTYLHTCDSAKIGENNIKKKLKKRLKLKFTRYA